MPHAADTTGAHDVLMRTQTKGPRVHRACTSSVQQQHRHRTQSLSSSSAHTYKTISRQKCPARSICMCVCVSVHHMSFFFRHTHTQTHSDNHAHEVHSTLFAATKQSASAQMCGWVLLAWFPTTFPIRANDATTGPAHARTARSREARSIDRSAAAVVSSCACALAILCGAARSAANSFNDLNTRARTRARMRADMRTSARARPPVRTCTHAAQGSIYYTVDRACACECE